MPDPQQFADAGREESEIGVLPGYLLFMLALLSLIVFSHFVHGYLGWTFIRTGVASLGLLYLVAAAKRPRWVWRVMRRVGFFRGLPDSVLRPLFLALSALLFAATLANKV